MSARLSIVALVVFLSACCALVSAAADARPIQQRIALMPDGMTVSWSTVGPISAAPAVRYGLTRNELTTNATGLTRHYESSTTWFHHVELHGLEANTTYHWQPITDSHTPVLRFTTAPHAPADGEGTFSVAIYGDLGIDNSEQTLPHLRQLAHSKSVDLFWHVGDLAYADDHAGTPYTYEEIMEGWFHNMTEGIWDETPYMLCPGNHENAGGRNSTQSQRNFTSYRERFHMPHKQSGSTTNMFYSFDYNNVHFINIDTESSFPGAPEGGKHSGGFGDQEAWLRADLDKAVANRQQVPWILVGGHRPFWATDGYEKAQMAFFFPIFDDYDIDAVFVGHIHYYERMYAISSNGTVCSKDYVQPGCPVYIVTGAAGNIEGLSRTNHTAAYTAKLLSDYGIGVLHVQGSQQLTWEFIESSTGKTLDSVTIHKKHSTGGSSSSAAVGQHRHAAARLAA